MSDPSLFEALGSLEPSDIFDFPSWLAGETRPRWSERPSMGNPYSPENWQASSNWLNEQMQANFAGFVAPGTTKIIGPVGGNRLIQALHDVTGSVLGELGYKDIPGLGAIIQSFRSKTPAATREMYGAFGQEMGPLLDKVKVGGNMRPEAWPSVQGALDRGVFRDTPNLAQQWRNALTESQSRYPNPENIQPSRWGQ